MQTFTKLTLFFALSAAAPHAINHFRLHDRHEHGAMKLIAERAIEGTTLVGRGVQSPDGQCGVGTGFVCAAGMCCSQYGFCGTGEAYCGSGSNKNAHRFGPPAYRTTRGKPTFVTGGVFTSLTGTAPVGTAPAYSVTPLPESSALSEPSTTPTQVPVTSASQVASTSPIATNGSATPVQTSASPSTPSSQPSPPASGGGLGDTYTFYTGSGATTAGWPSDSDWVDFDSLWTMNLPLISASCSDFQETDNSATESAELKSAISSVAASSGVDSRFILAIVMQESKGCVRVDTTNNGVVNPGLMQSHDGSGTCNPGGPGAPGMIPCPSSQITQMIKDGTEGTAAGDGLKQVLEQATGSALSQKYYEAATIYNSGNLPASGNLDDNTATACYASDIANRLTGWTTAQSKCTA